jgi:hypothetical protein
MKKNYFLVALFSFAMISMNAQFEDDMESYSDGNPIFENWWTDWGCGGGPGCAIMSSSAQAHEGSLSGYIPDDGSTDAVLDLGSKIFGSWGIEFYMYVPSGQEAYMNLQGVVPIGSGEWAIGNIFFNQDAANPNVGLIDDAVGAPINFDFPHDEWFRIVMNWNIDSGISLATWSASVDNVIIIPEGTPYTSADGTSPTSLGGFDFFSISALNMYWLDTLSYIEGAHELVSLSTEDFASTGFRSALNNDILTLRANEEISNVAIYNMLGQEVYRSASNTTSIDMSSYANGTYIVKVNVSGIEGSVKVVK